MDVTTQFGTVKIKLLKGEQGAQGIQGETGPQGVQGEPFEFEDFTPEQLAELRADVATVYYRKLEETVYTIGTDTSTIAIPFEDYSATDMLLVNVEGLLLAEGTDYTISGSNIVLTEPITHHYTAVNFLLLTAIALSVEDFDNLVGDITSTIESEVDAWLTAHPEATTTVQPNTVTDDMLVQTGGVLSALGDITGTERTTCTLANGTPPNIGNTWAVCSSNSIEVEYGDVLEIIVNREADTDCHYVYGFYAYLEGSSTRNLAFSHEYLHNGYSPDRYVVPSEMIATVRVAIAQFNTSGNSVALRAANFDDGDVEVLRYKYADYSSLQSGITNGDEIAKSGTDNLGSYAVFNPMGLGNGNPNEARYRVATDHIMTFDRDITLKIASGFKAGIHTFVNGSFNSDSGWRTGTYLIPANTSFKIVIARTTEVTSEIADVDEFVSKVTFETKIGARVSALEGGSSSPYSYYGAPINTKKNGFDCSQLSWSQQAITIGSGAGQGFGIFGDTLFQCYNGGVAQLYDMTDGSKKAEYTLVGDHCDCVDFSNEYYDASDEYPLMYVTADTSPAVVYVNRVTESGATLVRTLQFPIEDAGYYAGHATDAANNCLYMVGYAEQNYQTDPNGTNDMIVSKWDLGNLTNNGGIYTPEKLASFRIPFVYTAQGQCFFDGKIFIASSLSSAVQQTRVYVVDPAAEAVVAVITDLPSNLLNDECEGVAFHLDGDEYEMILGTRTKYYSAKF